MAVPSAAVEDMFHGSTFRIVNTTFNATNSRIVTCHIAGTSSYQLVTGLTLITRIGFDSLGPFTVLLLLCLTCYCLYLFTILCIIYLYQFII